MLMPKTPEPHPVEATKVAALDLGSTGVWRVSGLWTLQGLGPLALAYANHVPAPPPATLDGTDLQDLDTAGACVLQRCLGEGATSPTLSHWPVRAAELMKQVMVGVEKSTAGELPKTRLYRVGHRTVDAFTQLHAFMGFVGEASLAGWAMLRHRRLWRFRTIAHEVQIGGYEALPIIGLTSFLLGVVVAYQGADQLRHYGANVFVVELVGYAMLREFAPLISAIIIAGRSGSAFAAQIGTMVISEEVDALRSIGIDPLQRLVVPKVVALAIAMPLLTVFADVTGVFGGMVMARTQLDIGFPEFIDRFGHVMQGSALLVGVGKSLIFAFIISAIGCFQGLQTQASADSVGKQTTASVVQSIFLVIVVDALFSVVFNMLDI
jgi:phospholipid/cholesterol/gamma-HCH transport system permease protein